VSKGEQYWFGKEWIETMRLCLYSAVQGWRVRGTTLSWIIRNIVAFAKGKSFFPTLCGLHPLATCRCGNLSNVAEGIFGN